MNPHFLTILANTPPADPQISGNWITALMVAAITALGGIWLSYKRGQANPNSETTIKSPVPEVTVRQATNYASQEELAGLRHEVEELRADVDKKLDKLLEGQSDERRVAREALGKVHLRADKTAEALAEMKGELTQMNKNLERLLEHSMQPKPRPRA